MRRSDSLLLAVAMGLGFIAMQSGWLYAAEPIRVGTGQKYGTISSAVKAAKAGGVIEVGSGVYAESVAVAKRLIIKGADTGGGLPEIDAGNGKFGFHLTADGIEIDGFAITGRAGPVGHPQTADIAVTDSGVLIESDGNIIRNVAVARMRNGILLFGEDNQIIGNDVSANGVTGIGIRSGRNNRLADNNVHDNSVYGIFLGWVVDTALLNDPKRFSQMMTRLAPVEKNEVNDNTATGNGFGGIVLGGTANENSFYRNTANKNGGKVDSEKLDWMNGAGIVLSCGPSKNIFEDNDSSHNDNIGIYINPGFDNVFRRNRVIGNESIGVNVTASTGNRFEANLVTDNPQYGIVLKRWSESSFPTSSNLLFENDLRNNGVNAYDDSGVPFEMPHLATMNEAQKRANLEKYAAPNQWDNGIRGNHHDGYDETSEGFVDQNGDGVGEAAHPIPPGAAVDHFPLADGKSYNKAGLAPLPSGVGEPEYCDFVRRL